MKYEIVYTKNEELWKMEKIAESHGYKKTQECYWVQIFEDANGNHIVTTREDGELLSNPCDRLEAMLRETSSEEAQEAQEAAEEPADPAAEAELHKAGKMFASEKWYNIELTEYEWEAFREALKKDGEEWGDAWTYEASKCGVDFDGEKIIHVEIKCSPADLPYLNQILEEHVF